MAACRGIHHILDSQIPENQSSFIESLSSSPWTKIKPHNDHHSFTEIFGELHFKENPNNNNDTNKHEDEEKWRNISKFSPYHRRTDSSSSMNYESLQLCTEGIGFESLTNLEDLKISDFQTSLKEKVECKRSKKEENNNRKKGTERGIFPPPISSIRGGNNNNNSSSNVGKKPWVSFESYRKDGRFVLNEIRIPSQECLHASREDGRLRLSFVQHSDNEDKEEEIRGLEFDKEDGGEQDKGEDQQEELEGGEEEKMEES